MSRYRPNPPPDRAGLGPSCVVMSESQPCLALDFFTRRFTFIDPQDWLERLGGGDVIDLLGLSLIHI